MAKWKERLSNTKNGNKIEMLPFHERAEKDQNNRVKAEPLLELTLKAKMWGLLHWSKAMKQTQS